MYNKIRLQDQHQIKIRVLAFIKARTLIFKIHNPEELIKEIKKVQEDFEQKNKACKKIPQNDCSNFMLMTKNNKFRKVMDGYYREDFFCRISTIAIEISPLRMR